MIKKSPTVLILSLLVCVFMSACSATVEDNVIKISPNPGVSTQEKPTAEDTEVAEATEVTDTKASIEETVIPDSEWQLDVTFRSSGLYRNSFRDRSR